MIGYFPLRLAHGSLRLLTSSNYATLSVSCLQESFKNGTKTFNIENMIEAVNKFVMM